MDVDAAAPWSHAKTKKAEPEASKKVLWAWALWCASFFIALSKAEGGHVGPVPWMVCFRANALYTGTVGYYSICFQMLYGRVGPIPHTVCTGVAWLAQRPQNIAACVFQCFQCFTSPSPQPQPLNRRELVSSVPASPGGTCARSM